MTNEEALVEVINFAKALRLIDWPRKSIRAMIIVCKEVVDSRKKIELLELEILKLSKEV